MMVKWVCFGCKVCVSRSSEQKAEVRCSSCAQLCEYVGKKVKIPPKLKIKQWEIFKNNFYLSKRLSLLRAEKYRVEKIHCTEKQIKHFENLTENKHNLNTIKKLKEKLEILKNS